MQRDVTSDLTLPWLSPSVTLSNPCHRPCEERQAHHHHHTNTLQPPHWLGLRAGLSLVAGTGWCYLSGCELGEERRGGCNGYIAGGIILPNYQSPAQALHSASSHNFTQIFPQTISNTENYLSAAPVVSCQVNLQIALCTTSQDNILLF